MKQTKTAKALEELFGKGYVDSCGPLNAYLYEHPGLREFVAKFNPGAGKGRATLSPADLLGEKRWHITYYLVSNPEPLVRHLVRKHHRANPTRDMGRQSAFTKLLHEHNLDWPGSSYNKLRYR